MVYSATSASAAIGGGNPMYYLKRQGIFALVGLALLVVARRWNYRSLRHLAPTLLVGSLALLVLRARQRPERQRRAPLDPRRRPDLPALGAREARARDLGGAAISRSGRCRGRSGSWRSRSGSSPGVFCALVLAEPDLGTVIAICVMVGAMLLVAGAPVRVLGGATAIFGALVVCLRSGSSRTGARGSSASSTRGTTRRAPGYQQVQAMIGLGSGGPLRRRPRRERAEGLLPARGAHGHDLRDHRRGARPRRRHARDRRLRRVRLGGAADRAPLPRPVRQGARRRA